ncbi:MAG: Asp-tRNA(Asn)/Glu-tRNA(Gln) amidotransferase subunit GatC [Cyanobacteria bacterium P01_G01_bin.54]
MATIDHTEVQKVAHLARLSLSSDEEKSFTRQLSSILDYFEQLSELDTTDVEPTTRAIDISNITRPDQLQSTVNPAVMLEVAPAPDGGFFRVPQILTSDT